MLRFGAGVSTLPDHVDALDQVLPGVLDEVGGTPDLVACFFTMDYAEVAEQLALGLSERTGTAAIIGCTAHGVIAGSHELEGTPALAVWAARLPGVQVQPFALRLVELDDGWGIAGWPEESREAPDGQPATVVLLSDPFSFPVDRLLERLNEELPGLKVIGGQASGANRPDRHRLLLGAEALDGGAAGVVLNGPLDVRTVVSQGCRPIGVPYVVTRGDGNVVHELGGQPPVERLRQLLVSLGAEDRALLQDGGLQVGQVIDEHKATFDRGDFLIRPLAGADPDTGAVAVSDRVELGQTLQFHVRDAAAADEELELLLAPVKGWEPRGALLFTCNGRGQLFFGEADHDSAKLADATGHVPTAGFFAAGEIGPVGRRNFLHSYTASLAVFCEPSPVRARAAG
jgi:small ligand-binding sensory domain FIST